MFSGDLSLLPAFLHKPQRAVERVAPKSEQEYVIAAQRENAVQRSPSDEPQRLLCLHFLHGGCNYGKRCTKLHLQRPPCVHNAAGMCAYGNRCTFSHRNLPLVQHVLPTTSEVMTVKWMVQDDVVEEKEGDVWRVYTKDFATFFMSVNDVPDEVAYTAAEMCLLFPQESSSWCVDTILGNVKVDGFPGMEGVCDFIAKREGVCVTDTPVIVKYRYEVV